MNFKKKLQAAILLFCLLWQSNFLLGQEPSEYVEKVKITANSMTFEFTDAYQNFTVEVSGPDNFHFREDLKNKQEWTINSTGISKTAFLDGLYQIQVTPNLAQSESEQKILRYLTETNQLAQLKAKKELLNIPAEIHTYNRSFRIEKSEFVLPKNEAYGLKVPTDNTAPNRNLSSLKLATSSSRPTFTSLSLNEHQAIPTAEHLGLNPRPMFVAQTFATDLIVQGSECVGFDCVSSESFGFDTHRLKENNLRIHFDDTSGTGSFPSNDWRIAANDTSNGGANYLAFEDATGGTVPFRVMAGSGNNALYVSSTGGNVGLGTAAPVVELHVTDGDSPTVRIEQNGANGWTPQTWDIAGNETNFFVRDVTNGSKLPFKIKPGAPDNALFVAADGDIGLGTASPSEKLHIESGNINVKAGNIDLGGNMYLLGSILPVSDIRLKKNIQSIENGLATIQKLNATTYHFKTEAYADMNLPSKLQYGFIAQEIEQVLPALVEQSTHVDKTKNFKRVNYTGVIPVLVKGMQEQQAIIDQQQEEIDTLKALLQDMDVLKQQVAALAKMMETTVDNENAANAEKK